MCLLHPPSSVPSAAALLVAIEAKALLRVFEYQSGEVAEPVGRRSSNHVSACFVVFSSVKSTRTVQGSTCADFLVPFANTS